MKKIILLVFCLLTFNVTARACGIEIYVASTEKTPVVFTVISTDNKYQYTSSPIPPGNSTSSFSNIVCNTYNIYAQQITSTGNIKINPYGDYVYMYNPLQLTGGLSLYFPRDFQLDPA